MPPDFKYPSQTFIDSLPPQERERFEDLRTKFEGDYLRETLSNYSENDFLRSSDPYDMRHGHDHFGHWLQQEGYMGRQGIPQEVLRQVHEYKPEGWEDMVEEADFQEGGKKPQSEKMLDTARKFFQLSPDDWVSKNEMSRYHKSLFHRPEGGVKESIRETEGPGWEMTTPRTPSKKPSKRSPFVPFSEIYPGGVPTEETVKPDPWTHAAPREVTDKLKGMDPSILKKVRENPQLRSIFNLEYDPEGAQE